MPSVRKFDVCSPRPKLEAHGVWWCRIGRASENEKGQISVFFDALPLPDRDGRCSVMLFEARDKTEETSQSVDATRSSDDRVPF